MAVSGQKIGEYVLLEPLGQGTFGSVWLAQHHAWRDRLVAVKLPTNVDYVHALRREGLAIARVEHPNIVRAINFDATGDTPYLVLEYVKGQNLRQLLREHGPLPPDDVRAILTQMLSGLQAAHDAGIIHRDLKPENVLLHEVALSKGFASPGTVKLTDFGLGTVGSISPDSIAMSMQASLANAGKLAGTLDYMSPEQRAGETLDGRSDLFAVGVMMFEMLTGRKPVGGERPSDSGLDAAWDGLYLRACAPLRTRYESAHAFVEAIEPLDAVRAASPILTVPALTASTPPHGISAKPTTHERAVASPRRRVESTTGAKWVVGVIAVVLFAAIVAGGWAWLAQRERTLDEAARAEEARLEKIRALAARPEAARAAAAGAEAARVAAARAAGLLAEPRMLRALVGHAEAVFSASFSPDGRRVVTGSSDRTARLWDAETGLMLGTLEGHTSSVAAASFSPDGRRVVTGSWDKTARLWDADPSSPNYGQPLRTLEGHTNRVTAASFSPDGRRVVTASWDRTARLWESETGQLLRTLEGSASSVNAASFSHDGRWVITASDDHTARLWDSMTGDHLRTLEGHTQSVLAASFSSDGRRVVTGSGDHTARLWDAETGRLVHTLSEPTGRVRGASFSPDGRLVLAGSDGQLARLWDAETGTVLGHMSSPYHSVNAVAFSPDGRRVVISAVGAAQIWQVAE